MPLLKHCLAGFCLAIPLEICTKRGSESVTHSTKKLLENAGVRRDRKA